MGAGASVDEGIKEDVQAVLSVELQRPCDASDVATPRGYSALQEVQRLRILLAQLTNTPTSTESTWDQQPVEGEAWEQQPDGDTSEPPSDVGLGNASNANFSTMPPSIQDYLLSCFQSGDTDGSGCLSADEFTALLVQVQGPLGLSDDDVRSLHAQTVTELGEQEITWTAFVNLAPTFFRNMVDSTTFTTEWCVCQDNQGSTYYYNKRTGESSWEMPEELINNNSTQDIIE